jgi:hypothetical protein
MHSGKHLAFRLARKPCAWKSVFDELNCSRSLTENYTSGLRLRIRINSLPKSGDFDEFDLRRFRVGDVYDVPTRLASLLSIAGYAEIVNSPSTQAQAADYGHIRRPQPKQKR